ASPCLATCIVLRDAYLIPKRNCVNARAGGLHATRGRHMPNTVPPRRKRARSTSERAGVQSVVVAASVLKALATLGGAATLKELADELGMARAKVHRYLGSLRAGGLVAQNAETGRYHIGSAAVTVGLVGL